MIEGSLPVAVVLLLVIVLEDEVFEDDVEDDEEEDVVVIEGSLLVKMKLVTLSAPEFKTNPIGKITAHVMPAPK